MADTSYMPKTYRKQGGDEIVVAAPDGNSNSKLQINLPQGGTRVRLISDGTLWVVSGQAVSVTAPTFADQ